MRCKLRQTISFLNETFIDSNRWLALSWLVCLAAVAAISLKWKSSGVSFIGFAESRETVVNHAFPVEVRKIHVIPGKRVQQGELLAELSRSDLDLQIHEVRSELERLQAEVKLIDQVSRLGYSDEADQAIPDSGDPRYVQIRNLDTQLKFLTEQKKKLLVFSDVSGVVGTVYYKTGEMADPFTPILTVSPRTPTYVQGFINENLFAEVRLNQNVLLSSTSDSSKRVNGRIISVGSRITEFPLRLQNPIFGTQWGREVTVEIPPDNPFLLGEKVQIHQTVSLLEPVYALSNRWSSVLEAESLKTKPISAPALLDKQSHIEPSGAVYISELKKFLVISDDTDKDDSPFLFWMSADGELESQASRILGLDAMEDMEAVTRDEDSGRIYVLSSQSRRKSGKIPAHRTILAEIVRKDKTDFALRRKVFLREALISACRESSDVRLSHLGSLMDEHLDIEAMAIRDGELFLGLKNPVLKGGAAAILRLKELSTLLESGQIPKGTLSLWKTPDFSAVAGSPQLLSDMILVNQSLLLTTVCDDQDKCGGNIWRISLSNGPSVPEQIRNIPELKPEGIAFDESSGRIFLTFDQGGDEPGRTASISLMDL